MNKKTLILLAVVWTTALGLVGFSEIRAGNAPESSQQMSQQTVSNGSGKSADDASPPESTQRAAAKREAAKPEPGDQKAASDPGSRGDGENGVRLQLAGEPGIEFSGSCSVDGEERELEGRTPETYDYEPEERLECKLSSEDGALRVTFSGGGDANSTQQVGPGSSSMELTYTGDGFSLSTSSKSVKSGNSQARISRNSQTNQTSSSRVISSQSSSQTSSSGAGQSGSE